PRAQPLRRPVLAVTFRREPESLQSLAIQLQDDLRVILDEAHRLGTGEIRPVGMLEVELLRWQLMFPKAAIFHVTLQLAHIRRSFADRARILAAKARQRPDAGGS